MDCSQIQDRRITVLWCHGERVIRDDDWLTETDPPVKDAWVGYTFFRDLRPEPASGTLTSTSSSSTTKGQSDRTSSSMSSSLTSEPPPMPGIAEDGPLPDGQPREVRPSRRGLESDQLGSVSDQGTGMTEGMSSLGGYEQRLRGHLHRGEMDGSGTSGDSRELSFVEKEEIDHGWDYDPAYWAQGPGGHDGTTLDEDVRDDWRTFMRVVAVDVEPQTENRPDESETSSAERPDWRRSLASEDEDPPTLDEMIARGWRVVRNGLAPPRRESYRGPDHAPPPVVDQEQETPIWMGISTQEPVRPRSNDPWEPRRGFSGTSRVREDSCESDGGFEKLDPRT